MDGLFIGAGLLAAYLLGSIPASFLVCKWGFGVDLRTVGSGNVGATNALRALGPKAGVPALVLDLLKGTLAALLAVQILPGGGPLTPLGFQLACGVMAVLGHSFTIFLRFKGGKGVATAAGVFLALAPKALLLALLVFALVVGITGFVSLGSMLAAISLPLWLHWLGGPDRTVLISISVPLALFIVYRHRSNISRLLAGTEPSIRKPAGSPATDTGAEGAAR